MARVSALKGGAAVGGRNRARGEPCLPQSAPQRKRGENPGRNTQKGLDACLVFCHAAGNLPENQDKNLHYERKEGGMIQHMVVFKLKADVDEPAFAELEQKLADLPDHIAEIESLAFGLDVARSERSYDFGLLAGFKDLEALRRYQEHPKHQEVLTRLKAFAEQIIAVDFVAKG
jgi:hypothetical protein